ncbi:hypothetical protein Fmac_024328 [Flemingia macrophylla]|uniref:AP2/ERF domain-containing protein n=1 Tax=Flemingia macrophylla TaxID=520843 RepID=A0ABD1LP38_9FABA
MNWLDFSLYPQEQNEDHSQTVTPLIGFNSHEISATDDVSSECFDLTSFGYVESPNRNNTHHSTPLDWCTKGFESSCRGGGNKNMDSNKTYPKLENFLSPATSVGGSPKHTNSIGLSMIKTWLKNQTSQSDAANTSLSMSTTVSKSGTVALPLLTGRVEGESKQQSSTTALCNNQSEVVNADTVPRKSSVTVGLGQRTSIYRGVTRHRWTGRFEAHLWDNSSRREGQTRKGKQGGYDKEEKAARTYDLAALKYWGTATTTNFPISHYEKELEEMKNMTRQEYVASLRRHHQHGRWQARIGRVAGNKDLYLGTFSTQEEAAEAYDIAAIKFRGLKAVTNFEMNRYDVKSILESSTLPIGGSAKRLKDFEQVNLTIMDPQTPHGDANISTFDASHYPLAFHQPQSYSHLNYSYGPKFWYKQEQVSSDVPQTFQHQLGNSHNFLQGNVMSIDSASINNSSNHHSSSAGSNSFIYGGGDGYAIPMNMATSFIADDVNNQNNRSISFGGHNDVKMVGYENVFSSTDPYHARNLCYLSQQTSGDEVKGSEYVSCHTWVPTTIPTLAPRLTNMARCPASTFSLLYE